MDVQTNGRVERNLKTHVPGAALPSRIAGPALDAVLPSRAVVVRGVRGRGRPRGTAGLRAGGGAGGAAPGLRVEGGGRGVSLAR